MRIPFTALRLARIASIASVIALAAHAAPPPPPADAQRVEIPEMDGSGDFFTKTITVNIHFGRLQHPKKTPDATASGTNASGDNAPPPKSGKSGGKHRAGGGGSKGGGGSRGTGGDIGGEYSNDPLMRGAGDMGERTPNIREERNPSTQLHLSVTNHGTAPMTIEVLDFTSALGNFAVKPDKIVVAPGQTIDADPMISRLGIPTEDLPVKVRVRSGTSTEQQTLVLKMPPPTPSPAPTTAAPAQPTPAK